MPEVNEDLHGNVPDQADVALVLIDVINDLEFPGGEQLMEFALPAARNIAALKARAKAEKVPVIYANDNFGRWRSDLHTLVKHCTGNVRGRELTQMLLPDSDDYFVLKPKHSVFYSTALDLLLRYLQVEKLILTGVAGNICVLYSANDAYMRDYQLFIPEDCIASETEPENAYALDQMKRFLKATVCTSEELDLATLMGKHGSARR